MKFYHGAGIFTTEKNAANQASDQINSEAHSESPDKLLSADRLLTCICIRIILFGRDIHT